MRRVLLFTVALTAFAAEYTYHLPHIATTWRNFVLVDNQLGTEGRYRLLLYNAAGTKVYDQNLSLGAYAFTKFDPVALAADAESGSIETDDAGLRFRQSFVEPVQQGTAEFQLPDWSATALSFNLGLYAQDEVPLTWRGLALYNPGAAGGTADLYALDEAGTVLGQTAVTVAAHTRMRNLLSALFTQVEEARIARVAVLADQPMTGLNISGVERVQLLFGTAQPGGEVPVAGGGINTTSLPQTLPGITGLNLYAADSPLNTPLPANPEIDSNSDLYIQGLQQAGAFLLQVNQYSAPVFFADENTPRSDVFLHCGAFWELGVDRLEAVPIPDWAVPGHDAGGEVSPSGCGEDSDQDNNMIILDVVNRCEYDFWQARKEEGQWRASWGTAISMDSDGVYPTGMSSRGSGFAFLGGMLWPDEVRDDAIAHALVFSYPFTKSGGPVAPATDSDGTSEEAFALPEGAILQLDPDLDLDSLSLTAYERAIARALQTYGMILVDNGGDSGIALYAVDGKSAAANPWAGILPDGDFAGLDGIPLASFRVLRLPAQDGDWQNQLQLPANDCARHR